MALKVKNAAKFVRGLSRARFIPHCGNGTFPGALTGVFGGAGPFDFSAAHAVISAVPISLKTDGDAAVEDTLDLSGFTEAAVTAANFVTAFTAASITGGYTASVDATTGRLKIVDSAGTYLQVYGLAAELAGFGRGIGAAFIKADTLESLSVTPDVKADETDTVTDANGDDTSCIVEGYVKGATGSIVDTAEDFELMRLFSGGEIDADGVFSMPNSSSEKPYFAIEIFNPVYGKGESKQGEQTGWQKITVLNAMGSLGDDSFAQSWRKKNYTYTATTYKDAAGVEETAVKYEYLTLSEYAALDLDNV
ncbi:MAG: hypothetical protein PHS14_07975 [Elusimicrobia bacterium]|nr:hypothetical protein [Elusimicrobiota bacterium]